MHLTVLVFSAGNAVDLAAIHPCHSFARTFVAIPVCVHWIKEPNAAFESECTVCQCTYRANIDDISTEIVVDGFFNVGTDLRVVAPIDNTMYALLSELIGHKHTTEAHNAAGHVKFDVGTNVNFLKRAAFKLVAGAGLAVFKSKVLQVAFSSLIANRAIQRVVDEQKLGHRRPGFYYGGIAFAGDFHAVHDRGLARSHKFGHGPWIFFRTFRDAYKAGAALAPRAFQRGIVAHGWWHELTSNLPCRIQDGGAIGYFYGLSVYGNFCHFIFL